MGPLLKKINNQGIGLVETLLAVVFAVSLIVSLVTLANFNIRTALTNTETQRSISSANQLIENLRAKKDTNFSNFKSIIETRCIETSCYLNSSGDIVAGEPEVTNSGNPVSTFRVEIPEDSEEIKVNVLTRWKISNKDFSSPLSTIFTNWRSRP